MPDKWTRRGAFGQKVLEVEEKPFAKLTGDDEYVVRDKYGQVVGTGHRVTDWESAAGKGLAAGVFLAGAALLAALGMAGQVLARWRLHHWRPLLFVLGTLMGLLAINRYVGSNYGEGIAWLYGPGMAWLERPIFTFHEYAIFGQLRLGFTPVSDLYSDFYRVDGALAVALLSPLLLSRGVLILTRTRSQ